MSTLAMASAGASTRPSASTASTNQGAGEAPADLFQDLMQALSTVVDAAVLTGLGDASTPTAGAAVSEDVSLPVGPGEAALPSPDFFGWGLAIAPTLPTLPPAVTLAASEPVDAHAMSLGGLAPQSTLPATGGTTVPTVQVLLDQAMGPTSLQQTDTAPHGLSAFNTPPPTQASDAPTPLVTTVGTKSTPASWGAALDSAARSQAAAADPASPATMPVTPDVAAGLRQATPLTLDAPGVHHGTLQSAPSSPTFPQELVSELRFLLKGGLQQAELRMNPAELGPIQIELRLNADVADIGFTAAHATTREGIAQTLPQLREMLGSQGLSLGQTSVGAGSQHQQQAQQERLQPDHSPHPNGGVANTARMTVRLGDSAHPARGVLDLYA